MRDPITQMLSSRKKVDRTGRNTPIFRIVFVHGLHSSKGFKASNTQSLCKSIEAWVSKLRGFEDAKITIFDFDMIDILVKGKGALIKESNRLLKKLGSLQDTTTLQSKRTPKTVFIAHNMGGWVVQEALARSNSAVLQLHTVGIIFLGLPEFQFEDHWDTYRTNMVEYISGNPEKSQAGSSQKGRSKSSSTLDHSVLRAVRADFDGLLKGLKRNGFLPETAYFPPLREGGFEPVKRIKTQGRTSSILRSAPKLDTNTSNKLLLVNPSLDEEMDDEIIQNLERMRGLVTKALSWPPDKPAHHYPSALHRPSSGVPTEQPQEEVKDNFSTKSSEGSHHLRRGSSASLPDPTLTHPWLSLAPVEKKYRASISKPDRSRSNNSDKNRVASSKPNFTTTKLSKTQFRILLIMARSFHQNGELEQAKELYQQAQVQLELRLLKDSTINPGGVSFKQVLPIRLEKAIIAIDQGRFAEAGTELQALKTGAELQHQKDVKNAVIPGPSIVYLYFQVERYLAVSHYLRGWYSDARRQLDKLQDKADTDRRAEPKKLSYSESIAAQGDLAIVLGYLGHYNEALELCDGLLKQENEYSTEEISLPQPSMKISESPKADNPERSEMIDRVDTIKATLAFLHTLRGDYSAAYKINEEALSGREKQLGTHHFKTLDSASLKADLLVFQSKYDEAELVCQKTLSAMRKRLSNEHPSTLKTLGILVSIYTAQGRFYDAEETARYLVEKNKAKLGPHHPQTIESMNALAGLHASLGRLVEAENLQTQAVKQAIGSEKSTHKLGLRHPVTLRCESELAMIRYQNGDFKSAWDLAIRVLADQRDVLPVTTPSDPEKAVDEVDAVDARLWLSGIITEISFETTNFDNSRVPGSSSSVGKRKKKLESDVKELNGPCACIAIPHPSIIQTLRCVALLHSELSSSTGLAEAILKTIVNYHQARGKGEDNAESIAALCDLAQIHRQEGQLELAKEELKDAVERRTTLLGEEHPDCLSAKFQLSITNCALGHWETAEREQLKICDQRQGILGDDHPDTLKSLLELSNVYQVLGKLKEAEDILVTAITTQKCLSDEFGRSKKIREDILKSEARLAAIYAEREEFALAVAKQKEVLSGLEEMFGLKHPLVLSCKHDLAVIYQAEGSITKATTLYKFVRDNVSSDDHLYIAAMSNLASQAYNSGKLQEAEKIQEEVLEKQRYNFGDTHPQTSVMMFNLALTKKESGDIEGALGLMDGILRLLGRDHIIWNMMEMTRAQWAELTSEKGKGVSRQQQKFTIPPIPPLRQKRSLQEPPIAEEVGDAEER